MINKSENINDLATSLSLLQGEIEDIPKTKEVKNKEGKTQYKHAELSGVLEIARPLLKKYGLSVTQLPRGVTKVQEKSHIMTSILDTVLLHTSGQWISSTLEMTVDMEKFYMNDPQKVGTLITYARRYALAAILGISQVDDEQETLEQKSVNNSHPKNIKKATKEQIGQIKEFLRETPQRIQALLDGYKISQLEDLSEHGAISAINRLELEQKEKNKNFVTNDQIEIIRKLVTPERLIQIMENNNLTKMEDMTVEDYYKEYDKLRLETSVNYDKQQNIN